MKRGIYETEYGNTCWVSGPKAVFAWDIDAAEKVPIEMVVPVLRRKDDDGEDCPLDPSELEGYDDD